MAREGRYDVLIVDRMLPRRDGLSVVQALRAEGARTPVLILSALGEVDDRVKGLRAGGDDYLTKPYAYTELLARIEALARRPAPEEQATRYIVGELSLDRLSHKVTRADDVRQLSQQLRAWPTFRKRLIAKQRSEHAICCFRDRTERGRADPSVGGEAFG